MGLLRKWEDLCSTLFGKLILEKMENKVAMLRQKWRQGMRTCTLGGKKPWRGGWTKEAQHRGGMLFAEIPLLKGPTGLGFRLGGVGSPEKVMNVELIGGCFSFLVGLSNVWSHPQHSLNFKIQAGVLASLAMRWGGAIALQLECFGW